MRASTFIDNERGTRKCSSNPANDISPAAEK